MNIKEEIIKIVREEESYQYEIEDKLIDLFKRWALEMVKVYPEELQPFYKNKPFDQDGINMMDSYYNGANSVRIMAAKKIKDSNLTTKDEAKQKIIQALKNEQGLGDEGSSAFVQESFNEYDALIKEERIKMADSAKFGSGWMGANENHIK